MKRKLSNTKTITERDIDSMIALIRHTGLPRVYCTFRRYELVAKRNDHGGVSVEMWQKEAA
jgi:hypothetical protein